MGSKVCFSIYSDLSDATSLLEEYLKPLPSSPQTRKPLHMLLRDQFVTEGAVLTR